jgi:glyoxylate reductase
VTKAKVYVTRRIAQQALDMIGEVADIRMWERPIPPSRELLLDAISDVDGLLPLLTDRIDASLLDMAPKLRVISNLAVGYDNIDVSEATIRGILVSNTPGVLTETTADFAFTLLMAAARRVVEADKFVRKGRWRTWEPMLLLGQDIHNATLGIIGFGRIGIEVAKRARGFNMRVLYHDEIRKMSEESEIGVEYVPKLADLLVQSDFISLHIPLMPETHHLVGSDEFALMKSTAVLINTSRGPIVDPGALYHALASHLIFAAAIDVTDPEPIPYDSPLLSLDNLIVTPHIASASVVSRTEMAKMAAANLIAGLKDKIPPDCVNPEAVGNRTNCFTS